MRSFFQGNSAFEGMFQGLSKCYNPVLAQKYAEPITQDFHWQAGEALIFHR